LNLYLALFLKLKYHWTEHRRPDIVVAEQDNKMALMIDIAVAETRVREKDQQKVDKYQNFARELEALESEY